MIKKKIYISVTRYLQYFQKKASPKEQYDLEREMMQDRFDSEAYDGFIQEDQKKLATDLQDLYAAVGNTYQTPVYRINWKQVAAAATILFIIGSGILSYFLLHDVQQDNRVAIIHTTKKTKEAISKLKNPDTILNKNDRIEQTTSNRQNAIPYIATVVSESGTDEETTAEALSEISMNNIEIADEIYSSTPDRAPSAISEESKINIEQTDKGFITGVIVNYKNEPIPGVSISIKGTKTGTTSDLDGRFKLAAPSDKLSTLVISSIEFRAKEIKAKAGHIGEIAMQDNAIALEELVVTGYTSQKKSDVTGAVSKIDNQKSISTSQSAPSKARQEKSYTTESGISTDVYHKQAQLLKYLHANIHCDKLSNGCQKQKVEVVFTISEENELTIESITSSAGEEYKTALQNALKSYLAWQYQLGRCKLLFEF